MQKYHEKPDLFLICDLWMIFFAGWRMRNVHKCTLFLGDPINQEESSYNFHIGFMWRFPKVGVPPKDPSIGPF